MANRVGSLGGSPWAVEHPTLQDLNDSNEAIVSYVDQEINTVDNKIDNETTTLQNNIDTAISNIKSPMIRFSNDFGFNASDFDTSNPPSVPAIDLTQTETLSVPSSFLTPLKDKYDFVMTGHYYLVTQLDPDENQGGSADVEGILYISVPNENNQRYDSVSRTGPLSSIDGTTENKSSGNVYIPFTIDSIDYDNGFDITVEARLISDRANVQSYDIRIDFDEIKLLAIPKIEVTNVSNTTTF